MTVRAKAAGTAKLGLATLVLGGLMAVAPPGAAATEWTSCVDGPRERQATFARAAKASGVPQDVLMAVSFLQSRWDDHASSPSTAGGYGPMHLTLVDLGHCGSRDEARGETSGAPAGVGTTSRGVAPRPESLRTLEVAADLTGLPATRLRTDAVANICGGAALLASFRPSGAAGWSEAVARYSGAGDEATAVRFAEQVYDVIATGESRVTNDGHRVALQGDPSAGADTGAIRRMGLARASSEGPDCPATLECESIAAPYEEYGSGPGDYGNHDLADRPEDTKVDYIIIHDTEATWDTTLRLVTDPTYLA